LHWVPVGSEGPGAAGTHHSSQQREEPAVPLPKRAADRTAAGRGRGHSGRLVRKRKGKKKIFQDFEQLHIHGF